jgi:hypothetical protein
MIKLERLAPRHRAFRGQVLREPQVTAELRKRARDVGLRGFRSPFAYGTSVTARAISVPGRRTDHIRNPRRVQLR